MGIKKELGKYVNDLIKSRKENELSPFSSSYMPERDKVISLIGEIKCLLFPEHFEERYIDKDTEQYITGDRMLSVYFNLKRQLTLSFLYECGCNEAVECLASEKAEAVCGKFFDELPNIYTLLTKDVEAAFNGDPAAQSKDQIIFSYPCMTAITVYRIAHVFYKEQVPLIPRIMSEYAHSMTGIDINPGAEIGEYFFIDHGTGVVIGETTEIGDHVKLYQGVTLGALSTRDGQKLRNKKRHPTIEDNVTIYSNVSILGGDTVIGRNSVIGGNAFITSSVPENTRVTMKSPELRMRTEDSE